MPKQTKAEKAKKAREVTEKIADTNAVLGATNVKKLRDKNREALIEMGLL